MLHISPLISDFSTRLFLRVLLLVFCLHNARAFSICRFVVFMLNDPYFRLLRLPFVLPRVTFPYSAFYLIVADSFSNGA